MTMARATKKAIVESTIYVDYIDENDEMRSGAIIVNGKPSDNRALILAQKQFGKNCFVDRIETDVQTAALDAETFAAHALPCIEGEVYGRDYVTQTMERTSFTVKCKDADGKPMTTTLHYEGRTTINKLRNYAIEQLESKNVMVLPKSIKVEQVRMYMLKDAYIALASK